MNDHLPDAEEANFANSGTKNSWGMSYEWKDLPSDIDKMTGVDIDEIIDELESAAKKGNMNLDIGYDLGGSAHYFVKQYDDGETSVRLASGKSIDVDKRVTDITIRIGLEASMNLKTDWSDGDVGFNFDARDSSKAGFWLDIKTTEYFAKGDLVGADMTAEGVFEIDASTTLDGRIYADGDEVKFDGTSLDVEFKFELKAMEIEWRLEEESTIYSDITSGDFDRIYWDCDTYNDGTYREEWTGSSSGREYLDLWEDCGEMDIKWSTVVSYDLELKNFPATDLGLTNSQTSVRFSDSFSYSLQNDLNRFYMGNSFDITRDNYDVDTADGSFDTVQVQADIMPFITANLLAEGLEKAVEVDELEELFEDIEYEAEDWDRDYDDDDNELNKMERDFERSDLENDMEDFAEEFEESLEDIEDGMYMKFDDAELYMLMDEDSYNVVSPQFIVEEDGDLMQLIGPSSSGYDSVKTSDSVEIEMNEGSKAESKQSDIESLKSVDDLVQGSLEEESGFEMWVILVGIGGLLILLIPLILFLRKGEPEYYGDEAIWDEAPPVKTGVSLPGIPSQVPAQQMPVQQQTPVIQQAPPPMAAPQPQIPVRNCPNCGEGGVWYPEQKWHWCQLCNDWLP